MIESKNMNYAFNVEYMEYAAKQNNNTDSSYADKYNKELIGLLEGINKNNILIFGKNQISILKSVANAQRTYQVMYPGLLIGVGNPHMTKKMKGEVQLGFTFDYVTGAPYYPGSSLKGVIRNVFNRALNKERKDSEEAEKEEAKKVPNEYMQYLIELISEKTGKRISEKGINTILEEGFVKEFEDKDKLILENGFEETNKPTQRDKFYDTYVVGFSAASQDSHTIIGLDNLAPHGDILKHPIPITMLRIMPGTCITFSMELHEVKVDGEDGEFLLKKEDKEEVYFQIIEDFGIGAKTDVGYGILESINEESIRRAIEIEPKEYIANKDKAREDIAKEDNKDRKKNPNVELHVCNICGKPTQPNKKYGGYYSRCFECAQKQKQF